MKITKGSVISEDTQVIDYNGNMVELKTKTVVIEINKIKNIKEKIANSLAKANEKTIKEAETDKSLTKKDAEEVQEIMFQRTAERLINELSKEGISFDGQTEELEEIFLENA